MDNKKITVNKILKICKGDLIIGNENLEVETFSKDTRNLNIGDMYLGIKGEKVNGNDYIEEALKNGAMGCITDNKVDKEVIKKFKDKVIIKVDDTIKAIQEIAKYKRSLYNIPVIAVTGSVRKNKYKGYNCKCIGTKI